MADIEVRIPDIGDFADVPVIEVHVNPGDTVAAEDPLITLESDKATLDVPAPAAGTVGQVRVELTDLTFDLTDLQIVILQCQQCFNFLAHSTSSLSPRLQLAPTFSLLFHRAPVRLNFLK